MEILNSIPIDLQNFIIISLLSLLIGLEQRKQHIDVKIGGLFGTDRTLTLIGILGFILFVIDKNTKILFIIGGIALLAFLLIAYINKIKTKQNYGITSAIIALITYSLAPLIYSKPIWLVLLVVVTVIIVAENKEDLFKFSKNFGNEEFTTLAKFLIIAGIILPLLSQKSFSDNINISPFQIWLAVVAVSGISYFSYLLKKFVFPKSGMIITALLGGLYSSTATTIILAKKSKTGSNATKASAGIIVATGIMYLRILLLAWIFNSTVAFKLIVPFAILISVSALIGFLLYRKSEGADDSVKMEQDRNPLEFKTAFIFGALFSFFAVITNVIVANYGDVGVNILSFIVGVTDIDPYILNLFQTENLKITVDTIVVATLLATTSNNFIKMLYAIIIGSKGIKEMVIGGFSILIVTALLTILLV